MKHLIIMLALVLLPACGDGPTAPELDRRCEDATERPDGRGGPLACESEDRGGR